MDPAACDSALTGREGVLAVFVISGFIEEGEGGGGGLASTGLGGGGGRGETETGGPGGGGDEEVVVVGFERKELISSSENPSRFIFCRTAPSGNIFLNFSYFANLDSSPSPDGGAGEEDVGVGVRGGGLGGGGRGDGVLLSTVAVSVVVEGGRGGGGARGAPRCTFGIDVSK